MLSLCLSLSLLISAFVFVSTFLPVMSVLSPLICAPLTHVGLAMGATTSTKRRSGCQEKRAWAGDGWNAEVSREELREAGQELNLALRLRTVSKFVGAGGERLNFVSAEDLAEGVGPPLRGQRPEDTQVAASGEDDEDGVPSFIPDDVVPRRATAEPAPMSLPQKAYLREQMKVVSSITYHQVESLAYAAFRLPPLLAVTERLFREVSSCFYFHTLFPSCTHTYVHIFATPHTRAHTHTLACTWRYSTFSLSPSLHYSECA